MREGYGGRESVSDSSFETGLDSADCNIQVLYQYHTPTSSTSSLSDEKLQDHRNNSWLQECKSNNRGGGL